MHMTFEKIDPPVPIPSDDSEHPAHRAARMIKELHEENIAMIDGGFTFMKIVDGVGTCVNDEMRRSCEEQIAMCDQIMERSKTMDPKHWAPAAIILEELVEHKIVADSVGAVVAGIVPRG